MKILVPIFFLYFSIFANCDLYAGNTTLIANYPATLGSYNKIMLSAQANPNITCSNASNAGLLFINSTTNTLEVCANGQSTPVPYPETCFNQFCSSTTATPCSFNGCPQGYSQATYNGGQPMVDSFQTAPSNFVYSTVCCSTGSTILPSS